MNDIEYYASMENWTHEERYDGMPLNGIVDRDDVENLHHDFYYGGKVARQTLAKANEIAGKKEFEDKK